MFGETTQHEIGAITFNVVVLEFCNNQDQKQGTTDDDKSELEKYSELFN